ncbi:uncharacterized protein SOCE26_091720 [Sorangium cellulosum]|uniref:Enoyl reductase (ER) domain-containing protein n=1 Tax=Sorangium cellulosum TaxID=56 RepID=A0A2L0F7V9_SORCE|nr:NADP-dependent oxidoreductase [Sorangium cellulosum]AUX47650.1 uncharacterized protein SOCE26_091720 [Sorangium cellulosum]
MRAILLREFGGVEHFYEAELPAPAVRAGDVLVRVRAASFNPVDYKRRAGHFGGALPLALGHDAAGVVEAVGEGVSGLSAGDEVCAFLGDSRGPQSNGGYAELVAVPAQLVARKPAGLSWTEAAAVPTAGLSAYEAIVRHAALSRGQSVLITGASGGVGSFAVPLCLRLGAASIVATAGSERSAAYLAELGVAKESVISHRGATPAELAERAIAANGGRRFDVALDLVGGDMKRLACEAVGFGGRVVTLVEEPEERAFPVFDGQKSPLFARSASLHFEMLGARAASGGPADWEIYREELSALLALIESGQIRSVRTEDLGALSVETVREGHRRLEAGGVQGKLAMTVG